MKRDNSSKCNALIQEAHQFHQQGEIAKAEAACRKVQKLEPLNFNALQMLGAIALESKNYKQAIKFLTVAYNLHRNIPGLNVNLGLAYKDNKQPTQAKTCFERAIKLDSNFAPAYYNLAFIMAEEGDLTASFTMLGEADRCRPDHIPTLELLANVLKRLGYFTEAIAHYHRVLEFGLPSAELYFAVGHCHQANEENQEAVEAYEKAIELNPERIDIRAKLADALDSLNRTDEASAQAQSILAAHPAQPIANLVISRIKRRAGNLIGARDQLLGLPQQSPPDDVDAAVLTELGMVQDVLGDHQAAFKAFNQANGMIADLPSTQEIDSERALQLIESCKHELANSQRTQHQIDDKYPDPVFLVGFPRSGTTLTEQILASHASVVTSDERTVLHNIATSMSTILGRELEYPNCLDELTSSDVIQLRQYYWTQMTDEYGELILDKLFVDKMPLNLIHLGLIEVIFPKAKIIVALRDPRDVCLSCFMQLFDMNESMVQFLSLEKTAQYYAAVMGLWLSHKEKLQLPWVESKYEDIVTDLNTATQKLNNFLNLEAASSQEKFYEHAAKQAISTPSYRDVSTPVYDRAKGRWRHYAVEIGTSLSALEPYIKNFDYQQN